MYNVCVGEAEVLTRTKTRPQVGSISEDVHDSHDEHNDYDDNAWSEERDDWPVSEGGADQGGGGAGQFECATGDEESSVVPPVDSLQLWLFRPRDEWNMNDMYVVYGCYLTSLLRQDILQELGYTCSAGIAHNKILAKVSSSRSVYWLVHILHHIET